MLDRIFARYFKDFELFLDKYEYVMLDICAFLQIQRHATSKTTFIKAIDMKTSLECTQFTVYTIIVGLSQRFAYYNIIVCFLLSAHQRASLHSAKMCNVGCLY